MISFLEFITEGSKPVVDTGSVHYKELEKHLSKAAIAAVIRHPFHTDYVRDHTGGAPQAYRFIRDKNGFESVYGGNGRVLDTKYGKIRRMVKFDMKYGGRSVANAHLYHNINGERFEEKHGGNIKWDHIKSQHPEFQQP